MRELNAQKHKDEKKRLRKLLDEQKGDYDFN